MSETYTLDGISFVLTNNLYTKLNNKITILSLCSGNAKNELRIMHKIMEYATEFDKKTHLTLLLYDTCYTNSYFETDEYENITSNSSKMKIIMCQNKNDILCADTIDAIIGFNIQESYQIPRGKYVSREEYIDVLEEHKRQSSFKSLFELLIKHYNEIETIPTLIYDSTNKQQFTKKYDNFCDLYIDSILIK